MEGSCPSLFHWCVYFLPGTLFADHLYPSLRVVTKPYAVLLSFGISTLNQCMALYLLQHTQPFPTYTGSLYSTKQQTDNLHYGEEAVERHSENMDTLAIT